MKIRNRERIATALKWNFTDDEVTSHPKLKGKRYRAVTQVKGLSVEITIVPAADTVHLGAGSSFKIAKARS